MRRVIIILFIVLIAGCATTQTDYTKFKAANPHSILIVPVVNKSVNVPAPDYFLSTITIPVAEQGYYVFPVNLAKRILEDDGLSDANLVHSAPTERLCNLFGADAVLYVSIEKWEAKYLIFTTQVTVELAYMIKDGKTGDTLWDHKETMVYTPSSQSTGNPVGDLLVMAVNAAVTKAVPNYLPLAKQANAQTFLYPGPGIPPGPYAESKEIKQETEKKPQ
jgi:hypothetical protein